MRRFGRYAFVALETKRNTGTSRSHQPGCGKLLSAMTCLCDGGFAALCFASRFLLYLLIKQLATIAVINNHGQNALSSIGHGMRSQSPCTQLSECQSVQSESSLERASQDAVAVNKNLVLSFCPYFFCTFPKWQVCVLLK